MSQSPRQEWRLDLVALGFVLVAGLCALGSFGASYGGQQYLVVGGVGLLIGAAIAYGGTLLRQPYWLVLAEGIIGYFVFGAALVGSSTAVAHVLPGPTSLSLLARAAVNGWAGLLSTSPVVGNTQNLLVVPYLCALVCGLSSTLLALRVRRYPFAVIPPIAFLVVGILFGTDSDASRIIPGGLLAVVLFGWVSHTQRETRRTDIGTESRVRPFFGGGILVACALLGVAVAPDVPLAQSHVRYVLRDHVAPPFTLNQYPSPLSAFRTYVLPSDLRTKPLFTVRGAPAHTYLQIASMDDYNGVVYDVADGSSNSSASGNFATVGSPVSNQPCLPAGACHLAKITVHILRYSNVWLPSAGVVRSVSFSGPAKGLMTNAFRYNVATNGAVVSTGVTKGDSYTLSTEIPTFPPSSKLNGETAALAVQPTPNKVPSVVHSVAGKLTAGASSDYDKAEDLAKGLADEGAFSDGYGDQAPSLAGHGSYRIGQFLSLSQPVGDSEQYAAAMALMARSLGLPARVELGVYLPKGGTTTVYGKDVSAWVDVDLQGVGWYPFNPTPPKSAQVNVKTPPPTPSSANQAQYQPPAQPPNNGSSSLANATGKGHARKSSQSSALHLLLKVVEDLLEILLVLAIIAGPALAILVLKSRRRRRRRSASSTSAQIAGGWFELVDFANDMGTRLPLSSTRFEQTELLGSATVPMAEIANRATFGAAQPSPADVDHFWDLVTHTTKSMISDMGFARRLRVHLSLASIRPEVVTMVHSRLQGVTHSGRISRVIGSMAVSSDQSTKGS